MRAFRFAFFIPVLIYTTGAMADACWEIKKCGGNTCQLSASSDTPSDRRYFQCGGNGGCANGAIIYALSEYYKCGPNKWVKLDKDKLSDELGNVRECGDSNADNENTAQVWVDNDTYDFFRENKSGTFLDKSDICKKPKRDKEKKTQEKPPAAVNSDANTPTSKGNKVIISGTVVDYDDPSKKLSNTALMIVSAATKHTTRTDANGNFYFENTYDMTSPSMVLVCFSKPGFIESYYQAPQLNNQTIKLMSVGHINDTDARPSECTRSGGFTSDCGETCTCPSGFTTETVDENAQKCVPAPKQSKPAAEKLKESVPIESVDNKANAAKDETGDTKANTNPELQEKLKSAKDALAVAKEKENSWANRALGATTTAATSLGAMQLAEGISEKKADEEAEKQMRNYISTMKCEYGDGEQVNLGDEQTLPGGNELLEYYTEYKTLADNLKTTKAALGLRPGIESEVLYDRAQSGLYQYANTGKTGGAETSLFRALTDAESTDAAAWSEQKETASKKLKVGGGVAAGGAAVGIIGNAAINTDMIKNIKDAFKK